MRGFLLLLTLLLAGCGGSDGRQDDLSAGEFLQEITVDNIKGDFSESWEQLHPAHQKLISQMQFVYCGDREPELENESTVRALSVEPVTKQIPAIPQRQMQAVRIQIRDRQGVVDEYIAHAVRVGDDWRWALSAAFVEAVEDGQCPDGSPLPEGVQ